VKIGWIEGVEINLLSVVAGLDLRQPALKVPGFGRIDFAAAFPLIAMGLGALGLLGGGGSGGGALRPAPQQT